MNLYEYDRQQNCSILCGVDEAGRGPLAGPVVAAAVILPLDDEIEGINDSKRLTEKKRNELFSIIIEKAVDYGIGISSVEEIDQFNILQATFLAMQRAIAALKTKPLLTLIDGNQNPDLGVYSRFLVKGDAISASIAAASILAKVTRDRMMIELDKEYPQYQFAKHKGYGTKLHRQCILDNGVSPVHRRSFLKKMCAAHPQLSNANGKMGEDLACQYLKNKGYLILERNYRSSYGEIDIIAQKGEFLSFVEVKLRDVNCGYQPQEAVTKEKQKRILKTALVYLQENPSALQPRFDVIGIICKENRAFAQFFENAFRPEVEYELF